MSRPMTILFYVLLAAGTLCWLATVALTATLNESDQAGNGLTYSFAMIGVVVTWLLLAVLVTMSFRNVEAPAWLKGAALIAVPLSGVAAFTVVHLLKDSRDFAMQWPIITIIIAPLLMLMFALSSAVPAVRASVLPTTLSAMWMAVLALSILPFPLRASQKVRQAALHQRLVAEVAAERQSESDGWQAKFAALGDSSHLRDVLAFRDNGSNLRDEALALARTLSHRQDDAVEMLRMHEDAVMAELRNLNLDATPPLCSAASEFLREHAVNYRGSVQSDNNRFIVAAQHLDKYTIGMQWLAERGCSMQPALDAYAETANAYADSPERVEFLARLRHFATTAGASGVTKD